MSMDFSYTATRKKRQRHENNYTLGVNCQGPMKNRADFPQAVRQLIALKKQAEIPNPHIPQHLRFRQLPIEDEAQLERQWKR